MQRFEADAAFEFLNSLLLNLHSAAAGAAQPVGTVAEQFVDHSVTWLKSNFFKENVSCK